MKVKHPVLTCRQDFFCCVIIFNFIKLNCAQYKLKETINHETAIYLASYCQRRQRRTSHLI